MRKVKVSAVQMKCTTDVWENIANAEKFVRQAKEDGANIVLLPELFERQYFCQERRYDYYNFAKPTLENDAVKHFAKLAKELEIVIPVSFYERDGNRLFNSAAVIDADGEILGVYRKTHIPDDHYYQEKFYFIPGDTGFKTFKTKFGFNRYPRHLLGSMVPRNRKSPRIKRRRIDFLSDSYRFRTYT